MNKFAHSGKTERSLMPKSHLSIGSVTQTPPVLDLEITEQKKQKSEQCSKSSKGVSFLDPVDTIEVQVDQRTLLSCLNSRVAGEILNRDKNIYKKAGSEAIVRFSQDLESDILNMFEKPALLNKLEPESIHTLMTTLNEIGKGLAWAQQKRQNKFKDVFSTFMPGYEAEMKAFQKSFDQLNVAVRSLNAIYVQKLAPETIPL